MTLAVVAMAPALVPVDFDRYRVQRQARVGGMINEYRLAT
jgi:hypothetical protein